MNRGKPLERRTRLQGSTGLARSYRAAGGGSLARAGRLKPRSAKTADAYTKAGGRRDLVVILLAISPRCQIQVRCSGAPAIEIHERLKRSRGGNILDPIQAHMVTTCRACHEWTEAEPAQATERRMLLSQFHVCPPVGPC